VAERGAVALSVAVWRRVELWLGGRRRHVALPAGVDGRWRRDQPGRRRAFGVNWRTLLPALASVAVANRNRRNLWRCPGGVDRSIVDGSAGGRAASWLLHDNGAGPAANNKAS